jgi:hypothetical protein
MSQALRAYTVHHGTTEVGRAWTLQKDTRAAVCVIWTHPLGWDVRVSLNDELISSYVCRTEDATLDEVAEWRSAWEAKGWRE